MSEEYKPVAGAAMGAALAELREAVMALKPFFESLGPEGSTDDDGPLVRYLAARARAQAEYEALNAAFDEHDAWRDGTLEGRWYVSLSQGAEVDHAGIR